MNNRSSVPGFQRICCLFGIPLDTSEHLLSDLTAIANGDQLALLATPNPEILLRSLSDKDYKVVLSHIDVSLPDGTGLFWATSFLDAAKGKGTLGVLCTFFSTYAALVLQPKRLRSVLPTLHKGSDTFFGLHDFWNRRGHSPRIFYFGGEGNVPAQITGVMQATYPKVDIVGSCGGYPYRSAEEFDRVLRTIIAAKPEVVFVAMPNPKQERWLVDTKQRLEAAGVRLVCGFGGTFDFAVGKRKRAPKWMQRFGIEWLFRLLQEPQRLGRIARAVVVFPCITLKRKLAGKNDLTMA
ncbi:hypothetical protein COW46_02725 [Candidatus Gracilibacteria bacterium CG17_big_fil_post_rev_8_21_14_2_50_48_13]|nr:MAG: hypothetical protein COW46_02725 [Candidatus Gracilibacteria bacterium CG17_big_fil_post_rev_8_21_14_2_50_48_13]